MQSENNINELFNSDNEEDRILQANIEVANLHLKNLKESEFEKDKDELYHYTVFANTLSKCNEREVRLVFNSLNKLLYSYKLNDLLNYNNIYSISKVLNDDSETNKSFINILNSVALVIMQYKYNDIEEYRNDVQRNINLLIINSADSTIKAQINNFIIDNPWYFLLIRCSALFGNNFMYCIQSLMLAHDYIQNDILDKVIIA